MSLSGAQIAAAAPTWHTRGNQLTQLDEVAGDCKIIRGQAGLDPELGPSGLRQGGHGPAFEVDPGPLIARGQRGRFRCHAVGHQIRQDQFGRLSLRSLPIQMRQQFPCRVPIHGPSSSAARFLACWTLGAPLGKHCLLFGPLSCSGPRPPRPPKTASSRQRSSARA